MNTFQFKKPVYKIPGGRKYYYEFFTLEIIITDLSDFDMRILIVNFDLKNGKDPKKTNITSKQMKEICHSVFKRVCDAALKTLMNTFDVFEIQDSYEGKSTCSLMEKDYPFRFKFQAHPEFSPGNSYKLAIEIFKEKMDRCPYVNSQLKPAFLEEESIEPTFEINYSPLR